MKTLYLLRHAKSSWDDPGLDDFARPLAKRGRAAAKDMGAFLAAHDVAPDRILCSSARRTRETLERLRRAWHASGPVEFERGLYLADPAALIARLHRLPDDLPSVMLIGHNPGLHDLAVALVAESDAARGKIAEKFPTGAFLELTLPVARWRDLAPGAGRIARWVPPRELVSS